MVWRDGDGYGSIALDVDPPDAPRVLLPPGPNPTARGHGQTWVLGVPESRARRHLSPRALLRRPAAVFWSATFASTKPACATVTWDGRDFAGREVPPGIYFLRCRRPSGATESTRVVVIP